MQVKVFLNNLRIAPRKVRQVADLIRNKKADQARSLLEFTVNRSADPMLRLLNSAIATASNDFKLNEEDLYIYRVTVDEGPTLKRSHPMSRGRAYPIMKRTSHICIILDDGKSEESNKKVAKKQEKKDTKKATQEKSEKKTVKEKSKKTKKK